SGSTNVEVTDLPDRLPNAGLEHPLDSVHGRPLILIHFYAAPRLLPFVLDGQRQAIAEPLHTLEYTLTRLHDHGADLDQQLRRPHMRDRPSVCSGNVPEFHQGCSFACFRRRLESRPQWDYGHCTAKDEPSIANCCMTRPARGESRPLRGRSPGDASTQNFGYRRRPRRSEVTVTNPDEEGTVTRASLREYAAGQRERYH